MFSLKVGPRLVILTMLSILFSAVVAGFGFTGMAGMGKQARETYDDSVKSLVYLGRANGNVGKIAADILLSFQHNPAAPQASSHGHPVSVHIESAMQWINILEENWSAYSANPLGDAERQLVERFNTNYKPFKIVIDQTLSALRANDYSEQNFNRFMAAFAQYAEVLEKTIGELILEQDRSAANLFKASQDAAESARNNIAIIFIIGLILCTAMSALIIRSITNPLSLVQQAMVDIENSGDFTRRVPVTGHDEVGQAAATFNHLISSLQVSFKGILASLDQLMGASKELAEHASRAARTSEITSASASSMAAAVEQMSVSITHVSDNSRDTNEVSKHTEELAQQGHNVIQETVDKMRAMAHSVDSSSQTITELGKQSEQISSIVQVIKDVADQTNLLALNAAIEAARAGEQGRGFAVVADEVRKLAERTAGATGEIVSMISAIQESSRAAVQAMNLAAEQVAQSVALADRAGEAITNIQQGAGEVQQHVNDISSALTEQGIASQSIAQQVERVAHAAEENNVEAAGGAESVGKINAMAAAVRAEINKFKV